MKRSAHIWTSLVFIFGTSSFMFPERAAAALHGPCAKDIERDCGDLPNGVPQCLLKNLDDLSKSCRSWVVKYNAEKKSAKVHCKKAAKKLCPDTVGWQPLALCLQKHSPSEAPLICAKLFLELTRSRAVVTGSGGPDKSTP